MKRRTKRTAKKRTTGTSKRRTRRVALKLVHGQDFERSGHGEIVIPAGGFERIAEAIFSGREVTAAVDNTVVLRVKAK